MSSASTPPARRVVRENFSYLVNELRVSNYLDACYETKVLSAQDEKSLRNEPNRYNQARNFLEILSGKSEEIIRKFFEIVRSTTDAQPHIYQRLFPRAEQQEGTWQQDQATAKLYASSRPQQEELSKMGSSSYRTPDFSPITDEETQPELKGQLASQILQGHSGDSGYKLRAGLDQMRHSTFLEMAGSKMKVPNEAFLAKNGYKYDVFLCHAGENKEFVSKLCWNLCSYGILPFFDELSLEIGDDGHELMMEAVERTSRFVVPLITHELKGKPWPQVEMEKALQRHKRDKLVILPIFLIDPNKTLESTVPILREISKISGTKKNDGEQEDDFVMRVSKAIEKRVKGDTRLLPKITQKAPFVVNERLDEDEQLGPVRKRASNSEDKDELSEMASRLKCLTANDLGLADQVEVSVISASDYICKIQCTHKEPLDLYGDETQDSTRKLTEVHHISQLRMASKILTVEVAAEIDMQLSGIGPNNQDSGLRYRSNAKLELKTKDGKNIKEETPLISFDVDLDGYFDEWPKERLYFKVEEDIERASLSARFCSHDGSSIRLRNIHTITTVIVADQ